MVRIHTVFPDEFPEPWASDWGEDEFGLFMGFIYKGVRQNFRWIEPGTFLMGSPKDEPEREDDEIQHEVILSKGFWLADTTVTQSLWEAVMGSNPSNFKSANRPVEYVSWDDAQAFISKMNSMKSELRLCLPTEAQWEYACRSGMATAFSFGESISAKCANFREMVSTLSEAEVLYRREPVDTKSLPPNNWGLHEMHGNVWEWCQDWYEEYPSTPSMDPVGDKRGFALARVLRGGSWISFNRRCRSASRHHVNPALLSSDYGFRFARTN